MEKRFTVRAVMIDLDGTLLDTAPDLAAAANLTLGELGLHPLLESEIRNYIGKGVANLMRKSLASALGREPEEAYFERALALFEEHYDRVVSKESRPYPNVVAGLEAFKAKGLRLACITNKVARFTLPLLRDTGLADYFDIILSGDSLPRKKPDPLPLLHACEVFGIEPHDMLLIGDSANDAQAARAAGCAVFCVPYGYNEGRDVKELDVDYHVEDLLAASGMVERAPA